MSRAARLGLLLFASAAVFAHPTVGEGQQPADSLLPADVAAAVIDFWNDPRRQRFHGPTVVAAETVIQGDIAVLEGPFDFAGRVEGSAVVVNADVVLRPGAVLRGDLLLVGGTVEGLNVAEVRGEILRYPGRLRYRIEGGRMLPAATDRSEGAVRTDAAPVRRTSPGSSLLAEVDFLITTGSSYNRVEGLPITFGPRLRRRGPDPLHVHALAIYRTESGFTVDPSRFGYYVRAEQYLGGERVWKVGGTLHSVVDPIEDWHLSDLENGLATFLFHQDFRDHYEREGLSGFVTFQPRRLPLVLTGDVRWETHRSLPSGSPLTLFENAEPWRPQPLVAEGRLGSVRLQASYDTRSEVADPAVGWYLRGVVEQGFDAELTRPALEEFPVAPDQSPQATPARPFGRFTTGFADLRRYNRLSPDVRLNFRALIGGSLTGSPLPPQRQHAFGGEGSLPGFRYFSKDCGARDEAFRLPSGAAGSADVAYARYGCDGFAMAQVESRGKLNFRLRFDSAPWEDEDEGGTLGWNIVPDWVLFANTGTGWAFDDRPDEALRTDLGAGLLIERLGIFFAVPLDGSARGNVFVRLGTRF